MTDKAQAVMNKMKLRKLFPNPGEKQLSTQVDVGPMGDQAGSKFLSELNSLEKNHEDFIESMKASRSPKAQHEPRQMQREFEKKLPILSPVSF